MSKTLKVSSTNIEKTIMEKVSSNKVTMKPRWYFALGSVTMIAGLIASIIGAIFLTNLTFFLLRQHGPNGQMRLQEMLNSFPWWIPILAVCGTIFGIWMLKKYDFSYKKNFFLISISFIFAVILSAYIIDQLQLNDVWFKKGPMRRFYLQKEDDGLSILHQSGQGKGQGRGRLNR